MVEYANEKLSNVHHNFLFSQHIPLKTLVQLIFLLFYFIIINAYCIIVIFYVHILSVCVKLELEFVNSGC